jgi:hypothetical protein|tara:strand:+ start:1128 stop:1745 length:618 start_codon:yes stop_codon:yes gene_type:complete
MITKAKDIYNKDILLNEKQEQVMMEWEKPYMEECINMLQPCGHVLEIGFGLGYSANQIRKFNVKSHTIIESDDLIYNDLLKWADDKTKPVKGYWQQELSKLEKFDCIFFDDFALTDVKQENDYRIFEFYYKIAKDHIKPNSRFVFYCDMDLYWPVNPWVKYECKQIKLDIPDNCNYPDIKNLYIPLITFTKADLNLKKIYIGKDL